MKAIKFLLIVLLTQVFFSCSGSKDLSSLSSEERFLLAKQKFDRKDYLDAISEFENIIIQFSGTGIVDDAQYYLAYSYFKRGEYIKSAYEFSKLIRDYPTSEYVRDAQFMLAESYYELSPHYSLDQRFTEKAVEEYQAFIDFFPDDARKSEAEKKIKELNDKLSKKIFETAEQYRRMKYIKSAMIYYDLLLEKYPDSKYSSQALYTKIMLLVERSRNKEALDEAKRYFKLYQDSEYFSAIINILALNNDSDDDGVLDYLDKCPATPLGVQVDMDGCPVDSDRDGVPDYLDKCLGTPNIAKVDKDGCPVDSDLDGVPDYLDKCLDTPNIAKVDKNGCPVDGDKDGVPDYLDKCSDTPLGVKVNSDGCPVRIRIFEKIEIYFDFDNYSLKPDEELKLVKIVELMKEDSTLVLSIEGYSCPIGYYSYNMKLSERRAKTVYEYFLKNGIDKNRFVIKWFGEKGTISRVKKDYWKNRVVKIVEVVNEKI